MRDSSDTSKRLTPAWTPRAHLRALPATEGYGQGESREVEPGAGQQRWPFAICLFAAMMLGLAVRLFAESSTTFPVGDGGMFYVMVQELVRHHFALPLATSYNSEHIPFTYPPLGFYIVAAIRSITGWNLLTIFSLFPLIVNVLSIGAFGLLARTLLKSRIAVLTAVSTFALLPQSFDWEIQGGGITRSLGMLFAFLTLREVVLLCRNDRRHLIPAACLAALTVLSHLEWTWFVAYSTAILFAFRGRSRDSLINLCLVAAGALALISPWLYFMLSRHGTGPFVAVLTSTSQVFPWYQQLGGALQLNFSPNIWFPWETALGLLGVAVCVARRQRLLPCWLLAIIVIDGRAPMERIVVVLALLAGIGLDAIIRSGVVEQMPRRPHRWLAGVAGMMVLWAVLSTLAWEGRGMGSVSPSSRSAMAWVSTHTPRSSTFAVITSAYWALDFDAEWFPALAGRRTLNTVQGAEWLPGGFARRYHLDQTLQKCALRGASCVSSWMRHEHLSPSYVLVAKQQPLQVVADASPSTDCCWSLRASLNHDTHFTRVYDGPAASIYRVP